MRRTYLAVIAAVMLAIPMASMAQERKPESRDKKSRRGQEARKAPRGESGEKSKAKGQERDGRARYEPMPEEHHDHLIDVRNGEVIEFRNEEIEKLQKLIARELGYKLVDHRLELYGIPLKDRER